VTVPRASEDAGALLRIAVAAAAEAGRLLASWRGDERPEVVQTKSSPTDVVTEMDRRSEALITSRIRAYRPGDAVLGEEGALVGGLAGRAESTSMAMAAGPGLYQQLGAFLGELNPERDGQRNQEREA